MNWAQEPATEQQLECLKHAGCGPLNALTRGEAAKLIRQEFWLDTCREAGRGHLASHAVHELYQKHGCRFTVPSREQVQEVLDALDAAMPLWEREHPEMFFQTLELNFPELLRHR